MPVPKNGPQWWLALIAAGATPIQAAGIMGNLVQEHGGDPEIIEPGCIGGPCFTLPFGHGVNASGGSDVGQLVTGDVRRDIQTQVQLIKVSGGFEAASGNDPATAAVNFMRNWERCDPALCNEVNRRQSASDSFAALSMWIPVSGGSAPDTSQPASVSQFTRGLVHLSMMGAGILLVVFGIYVIVKDLTGIDIKGAVGKVGKAGVGVATTAAAVL